VPSTSRARAALMVLVAAVFVLPLVFLALGSLRTPGLPPAPGLEVWPDPLRPQNYVDAARAVDLPRLFANSAAVALVAVPVTVLVASWAGFAATVGSRRTRRAVLGVALVAFTVPPAALWVPQVALLEQAGLTDRLPVVAFPALMATSAVFVLLFWLAYRRIPRSLYDAAAVEGLSGFRTWWTVAWPLGRSTTFAVAVLAFIWHWSNLVSPLLLLPREETWPVALGLRPLASAEPTFYPLVLAACLLATAPVAVAFLLAQRTLFVDALGGRRAS